MDFSCSNIQKCHISVIILNLYLPTWQSAQHRSLVENLPPNEQRCTDLSEFWAIHAVRLCFHDFFFVDPLQVGDTDKQEVKCQLGLPLPLSEWKLSEVQTGGQLCSPAENQKRRSSETRKEDALKKPLPLTQTNKDLSLISVPHEDDIFSVCLSLLESLKSSHFSGMTSQWNTDLNLKRLNIYK